MKNESNIRAERLNVISKTKEKHPAQYNSKDEWQAYFMLIPQIIGFFVFSLYPILWVIRFAWYDYDGVIAKFIGFDNFLRVFSDVNYWNSLVNILVLTFGKLAVELPIALILAILLNSKLKGKSFCRTIFYMPNIVSVAIIGLIFYVMFATFGGIINNLLVSVGWLAEPKDWFGEKWSALLVVAIASIWQNFGINMLFFLSGLQNIPKDLYECAEIDGANIFQQFTHITIPMLAPVMQVVVMLAIIGSIKMTDLVLVLTNGQPAGSTEVVMTYIFKYFFKYGDASQISQIGYGSSMALVTAVFLGLITVLYMRMTKKMSAVG